MFNFALEGEDDAGGRNKLPRVESPRGAAPPTNAPANEAGIPPQNMSVAEMSPPKGDQVGC